MGELDLTLEAPQAASSAQADSRAAVVAALMLTIALAAMDATIVVVAVLGVAAQAFLPRRVPAFGE